MKGHIMKNRDIMYEVSRFTPGYCHSIDSIFSSEKWDSNRTYLIQLLGRLNEVQHGAWQVMVGGQKPHSQSACRLVRETRGGKNVCFFWAAWAFVNKFPEGRFRHLPFFRDMKRGELKTFPMLK